jgi:hypothetical protein
MTLENIIVRYYGAKTYRNNTKIKMFFELKQKHRNQIKNLQEWSREI